MPDFWVIFGAVLLALVVHGAFSGIGRKQADSWPSREEQALQQINEHLDILYEQIDRLQDSVGSIDTEIYRATEQYRVAERFSDLDDE